MIHSLTAKICFPIELAGIAVKDIKEKRPDLRKKAKGPEFACQFGGGARAIANTLSIPYKEAKEIEDAYKSGFKGITFFKAKGSKLVCKNGYVLMNPITGHKMYWEDHAKWKTRQEMDPIEFSLLSKEEQEEHSKAKAYWERMALNSVTQGTGIIILKFAMIHFFKWIVKEGLFNKVLICDLVHDEAVIEYPKELKDTVVPMLKQCMERSAAIFCKKLPIPAAPETGLHWIH